jgi:hypothetical protein
MVVLGNRSGFLKAVYTSPTLHSIETYDRHGTLADLRPEDDYVPWDGGTASTIPKRTKRWHKQNNLTLEGENIMALTTNDLVTNAKKLYTFKGLMGEEQYGHEICRNSKGQVVIEIKGSCDVRAFDPTDLTEVCPYTFKAQALGHRARNEGAYTCHYECTEGQVAVDQVLMSKSGNLYVVVAIDTKNANPKAIFKGHKVPLVPFG